jgi:hypothetical protein
MCMFCWSLFVILSFFLLAIVLSVLRITDSDYPSVIFKLMLLLFGTSDCCQNVLFIFFRHVAIHHDCEDDKPFQSIKLSCVRENKWDNQEWTIQVYWQRCTHNTQDLDVSKQPKTKQSIYQKAKKISNTDTTGKKNRDEPRCPRRVSSPCFYGSRHNSIDLSFDFLLIFPNVDENKFSHENVMCLIYWHWVLTNNYIC